MIPVYGTYERTYYYWLSKLPKDKKTGYFVDGKMYSGISSTHLSPASCRLRKLMKINSAHKWAD